MLFTKDTKSLLVELASLYETPSFLSSDPSQFLRHYNTPLDIEIASFITALLSFGSREQFIAKLNTLFLCMDKAGGAYNYIKTSSYTKDFPNTSNKFYRFYSYSDLLFLFNTLHTIIEKEGSFERYIESRYYNKVKECSVLPSNLTSSLNSSSSLIPTLLSNSYKKQDEGFETTSIEYPNNKELKTHFFPALTLLSVLSSAFTNCRLVPKGEESAKKRLCLFLRWMVRDNSPVDLGLWKWFNKADLVIPLDVHVIKISVKLGLLPATSSASLVSALRLTYLMRSLFPSDPARADFALFGLGVDKESGN